MLTHAPAEKREKKRKKNIIVAPEKLRS